MSAYKTVQIDYKEFGFDMFGTCDISTLNKGYQYTFKLQNTKGRTTQATIKSTDYMDSPRIITQLSLMYLTYVDYLGYEGFLVCNGFSRYDINNNYKNEMDNFYFSLFKELEDIRMFFKLIDKTKYLKTLRKTYKYKDIFSVLINIEFEKRSFEYYGKYTLKYNNKQMTITLDDRNFNCNNPVSFIARIIKLIYKDRSFEKYRLRSVNLFGNDYNILITHLGKRF